MLQLLCDIVGQASAQYDARLGLQTQVTQAKDSHPYIRHPQTKQRLIRAPERKNQLRRVPWVQQRIHWQPTDNAQPHPSHHRHQTKCLHTAGYWVVAPDLWGREESLRVPRGQEEGVRRLWSIKKVEAFSPFHAQNPTHKLAEPKIHPDLGDDW